MERTVWTRKSEGFMRLGNGGPWLCPAWAVWERIMEVSLEDWGWLRWSYRKAWMPGGEVHVGMGWHQRDFQHSIPSSWKPSKLKKVVKLSNKLWPQSRGRILVVLGTTGRKKQDRKNVAKPESVRPDVWLDVGNKNKRTVNFWILLEIWAQIGKPRVSVVMVVKVVFHCFTCWTRGVWEGLKEVQKCLNIQNEKQN